MNIKPKICHANDLWEVLGVGVTHNEYTYCHLASLTREVEQVNGFVPAQIGDWVKTDELNEALEEHEREVAYAEGSAKNHGVEV